MPYDDGGHYWMTEDAMLESEGPYWFDVHANEHARNVQVALGCLFNATIRWLEADHDEDVVMATYDTEGKPEDEKVFFSFPDYATQAALVQDMKEDYSIENPTDDWVIMDCELYH